MMYPRLKLSRNLLKDDGVLFFNIGEEEVTNSEKILNELFGEENKVSIVSRVVKTASNLGRYFAPSTDFILCYAKDINSLAPFKGKVDESLYKKVEADGVRKGDRFRDDIAYYQASQRDLRPNQKYFVECPDGSKVIPPCSKLDEIMREGDGRWRWSKQKYLESKNLLVFKETKSSPLLDQRGEKAKYNVYTKSYLADRQEDGTLPRNILTDFINRKGADLIKKYEIQYDFSKPIELMRYLAEIVGVKDGDVVLDFFSGSCSTAHAILEMNRSDGGSRKFVMIQLPESCGENTESFKAGFSTIAEIGKERIRRVIKKIEFEQPEKKNIVDENLPGVLAVHPKLDLGFKVFKLDASNIKL